MSACTTAPGTSGREAPHPRATKLHDPRCVLRQPRREDLKASRAFYEKLGFEVFAGQPEKSYLILRNGSATIGLFQGMFERNILTFNRGCDGAAQPLAEFADVREVQRGLRAQGIEPKLVADEASSGPASLMVVDPDGNEILIDQHR